MSIFIIMEIRNLIRQVLKEEIDVKDQYAGWVNVNVNSSDLKVRIERFAKSFGLGNGNLSQKLDKLSNPKSNIKKIQEGMAAIVILQYIKQIRDNFGATTSGFLFEEVIAGLLPGETTGGVKTDYSKTDIVAYNGVRYQSKMYSGGNVKVKYYGDNDPNVGDNPDFIIFAMKKGDIIRIFEISLDDYKKHAPDSGLSLSGMNKISKPIGVLDTKNIDGTVKDLLKGTYESFNSLFRTVSDLEANLEGMITGVTEGGEKVNIKSGANIVEGDINNLVRVFEELKDKL